MAAIQVRKDLPKASSLLWRTWCTRDPETSPASRLYLLNCRRAAEYFNRECILSDLPLTSERFRQVMVQMHLLTVANFHRTPTRPGNPQKFWPDTLRDDLLRGTAEQRRFGKDQMPWFSKDLEPVFAPLSYGVEKGKLAKRLLRLIYSGVLYSGYVRTSGRYFLNRLPELSAGCQVHTWLHRWYDDTYKCKLPGGRREVREMFDYSAQCLRSLLEVRRPAGRRAGPARERILRELARYYQTMVIARPFYAQNNSLIMNQVNCILYHHFGVCLAHSSLDLMAMIVPRNTYLKLFRAEVLRAMGLRSAGGTP